MVLIPFFTLVPSVLGLLPGVPVSISPRPGPRLGLSVRTPMRAAAVRQMLQRPGRPHLAQARAGHEAAVGKGSKRSSLSKPYSSLYAEARSRVLAFGRQASP